MVERVLRIIEKFIPKPVYRFFQPVYHYTLALIAAIIYLFPSRKLTIIAVTGTKGKSTTVEILSAILREAEKKTASLSTVRFVIDKEEERNLFKMTLPGRFFVQKFLRRAVSAGCTYAVLEMTSEGVRFFRHKFISFDALIFTNLSPEHIESHGTFPNYREAKLKLADALNSSKKGSKILAVNADDENARLFVSRAPLARAIQFRLKELEPLIIKKEGLEFVLFGQKIISHLSGEFNAYNILAAATAAKALGVPVETIKTSIEKFKGIRGRMEKIEAGQDFTVVVDYAHTADSMEKVYEVFQTQRKICVFGATGGGRDKWKRPEMGKVAAKYCEEIILTNDDPYDEDPIQIAKEIQSGIFGVSAEIIINRREAIRKALSLAQTGDAVLITGKGSDPYLMEAGGKKMPWDDASIVREELGKLKSAN